jgi:hypothetical protein
MFTMDLLQRSVVRCAAAFVLLGGVAAGCAAEEGAELSVTNGAEEQGVADEGEPGAIGINEESLTSTADVDCSICAIAKACCNAVGAGSYCNNFNADRCATLDPGRQETTKRNCLTLLRTTISAWRSNGRTPPAECYIPGE